MKHILIILIAALILLPITADARPGGATAIFLLIPAGVRSTGMGDAYTAVAEDASAVWWNPAALAFIQRSEIGSMSCNSLPGYHLPDLYLLNRDFFHHIRGVGSVGGNYTYLDLGESLRFNELGQVLEYFHTYELAVTGAYGIQVSENLAFGAAAKYIYSHLSDRGAGQEKGDGTASGVAVDLSMLYRYSLNPQARIQFGANLANMGPKMSYIDRAQADPIPTNLRMGTAFIIQHEDYFKVTLSAELEKGLTTRNSDGSTDPFYKAIFTSWCNDGGIFSKDEINELITHFGFEVWAMDILALRYGVWNNPLGKINYPTFGLSLQYVLFRFDYSHKYWDSIHAGEERFQLSFYIDHLKLLSPTPWKW
ncbi:MAG: PorV/PorQ family protein [Candidatus Hatepunaea meridiana]|nr:PorV/PorQ family protein [Candidatus Hatepunaea meridiana]